MLLALDTSTSAVTVALLSLDGGLLAEQHVVDAIPEALRLEVAPALAIAAIVEAEHRPALLLRPGVERGGDHVLRLRGARHAAVGLALDARHVVGTQRLPADVGAGICGRRRGGGGSCAGRAIGAGAP